MTAYLYGNALVQAFTELDNGGANKTPKVMLLRDTYTFDASDVYVSEVSTYQATGTSYTAGGLTLSGVTYTYDAVTGVFTIDAADLTPAGLSVLCRYAVVYYDTGTPATSPLLCCVDLTDDAEDTITGLPISAAGLALITVALP